MLQEDELLKQLVEEHGTKKWAHIATKFKGKGSKQCRRRWKNFLNMNVSRAGFLLVALLLCLYPERWPSCAAAAVLRLRNRAFESVREVWV